MRLVRRDYPCSSSTRKRLRSYREPREFPNHLLRNLLRYYEQRSCCFFPFSCFSFLKVFAVCLDKLLSTSRDTVTGDISDIIYIYI